MDHHTAPTGLTIPKPQFRDSGLFKYEYGRLKFSINKADYDQQMSQLQHHNQALAQLTKQSIELEPLRQLPKIQALSKMCKKPVRNSTVRVALQL